MALPCMITPFLWDLISYHRPSPSTLLHQSLQLLGDMLRFAVHLPKHPPHALQCVQLPKHHLGSKVFPNHPI